MKRLSLLLPLLAVVSACTGDSSLPEPTGKASVRAINAVPGSPAIEFLIEARTIDAIAYKSASSTVRYDDFEYNFNFEVLFAGESSDRRVATTRIDFEPDRDYTLLLTGTVDSTQLSVFETDERMFDAGDTVFRIRFANTVASLGNADYYFAPAGVAPQLGEQVATLAMTQMSAPMELAAGDYVLTITRAGDPTDVLFESRTLPMVAQSSMVIATFAGDENDIDPVVVRGLDAAGTTIAVASVNATAAVEFLHAAIDLGTSDIYRDEALTEQLVNDHAYGDLSPTLEIPAGTTEVFYTPAGSVGATTLQTSFSAAVGVRYRSAALGSNGSYTGTSFPMNRAAVSTGVRVNTYQTSDNFTFLNYYAVSPGSTIEDSTPFRIALGRAVYIAPVTLAPGQYDLYVTDFESTTPLAGPVNVDVAYGDVLDIVVTDTADPNVLDLRLLSTQ